MNTSGEFSKATKKEAFPIDENTYKWTYRAMGVLFNFLKLNIRVHGDEKAWHEGHLFLFNHFARFEAIIPQFIIYKKTQCFSRSIATKDLFSEDSLFSQYLKDLGGIPNDTESLLYHVATDILKDHKLVAFPEGGIVKDRQSIDSVGEYQVYSRSSKQRRKLHTGPAVIALSIAIFKSTVRQLNEKGEDAILQNWAEEIGIKDHKKLISACQLPTKIIPCCITFYPLRLSQNILTKGLDLIAPDVAKRVSEELLIEGNLLLKGSDMDIQLGETIVVEDFLKNWEGLLLSILTDHSTLSLKALFDIYKTDETWGDRVFKQSYLRNIKYIRDHYMHNIYAAVTINIAHIASTLLMSLAKSGVESIPRQRLHRLIYIVIKKLQLFEHLNFHPSLSDPSIYHRILYKKQRNFDQFLRTIRLAKLVTQHGTNYLLSSNLISTTDFDSIRYKNPVAVYRNEVRPIPEIQEIVDDTLKSKLEVSSSELAELLFDDEIREYWFDKKQFELEKYQEINALQIATQSAEPFLLKPKDENGSCVVLVHGLLASPAEMFGLAEKLIQEGYIVIGTRLKGHGTSPWDLEQTTWESWYQSLKQSLRIAQFLSPNIHLVGFSCGALLALLLAAHKEISFKSVTSCAAPFVLKDRFAALSTIMHAGNKLVKSVSLSGGVMPFMQNKPENPDINYQHIPISSVSALLSLANKTKMRLKRIQAPTLCMQAIDDPVVDKISVQQLLDGLTTPQIEMYWVKADIHGVLYQNTDNCQQRIISFIKKHTI